jgi:hypothetical protein
MCVAVAAESNSKIQEMIMTRTLATFAIALSLFAGGSVAHADGNLMVHGYQGTAYGGR